MCIATSYAFWRREPKGPSFIDFAPEVGLRPDMRDAQRIDAGDMAVKISHGDHAAWVASVLADLVSGDGVSVFIVFQIVENK